MSWPATEPAMHQASVREPRNLAPADAGAMGGRVTPGHDIFGESKTETALLGKSQSV